MLFCGGGTLPLEYRKVTRLEDSWCLAWQLGAHQKSAQPLSATASSAMTATRDVRIEIPPRRRVNTAPATVTCTRLHVKSGRPVLLVQI